MLWKPDWDTVYELKADGISEYCLYPCVDDEENLRYTQGVRTPVLDGEILSSTDTTLTFSINSGVYWLTMYDEEPYRPGPDEEDGEQIVTFTPVACKGERSLEEECERLNKEIFWEYAELIQKGMLPGQQPVRK